MKILALFALLLFVAACGSPPRVEFPNGTQRIPINKNIPTDSATK